MRTKQKKDWDSLEKNKEHLHSDSVFWKSEINFIQDEIRFLEHLLSSNYIDYLEDGLFKKIEAPVVNLTKQKKISKALIKIIVEHEAILSNLIDNKSAQSNKHFQVTHKKIKKEVGQFIDQFKQLKATIFFIVERVMRKKGQKKLIS